MKAFSLCWVVGMGLCAANAANTDPVFDIPRIDGVTIDGKGDGWGEKGFRVDTLASDAGEVRMPQDFDAKFRLGWDDRGLLVLVTVHERKIVEADDLRDPSRKDSVEMILGTAPQLPPYFTVTAGTGADPRYPSVRTYLKDDRAQRGNIPASKLQVETAATHTPDGYVLEARLPWSDLAIKPVPGKVVAFQLRVNDVDEAGSVMTVDWCPGYRSVIGVPAMCAVRLANTPARQDIRVAVRAVLDEGRPRVDAIGPTDFAGRYLTASERSKVFTAGDRVFSFGQFVADSGRARASLFLPLSTSTTTVISSPDHSQTVIEDIELQSLVTRAINNAHVVCHPCVFSGEKFPPCAFEPSDPAGPLGKCVMEPTFYDAAYHEVKTAASPGRYGAIVQVKTLTGQTFKRFVTLYRTPKEFNWRLGKMHIGSLDLPPEFGVDPAVVAEWSRSVDQLFKDQMFSGLGRTPDTAVLFAGLSELKPGGEPATDRTGPAARDQQWWYGLKKQTGNLRTDYYLHLPASYDSDPNKKWPLILFLHGSGERGYDVKAVTNTGLPHNVERDPGFPFIVVAPQCSPAESWSPWELNDLLDRVEAKYRVDSGRVYLTGLSMGGYGSWKLAIDTPGRFAAVAPICGAADPDDAARIKDVPVWAFHGGKDPTVPIQWDQAMVDALKKAGGNVKFTIFPEAAHDSWTQAYAMPELYDWMLRQHGKGN